MTARPMPLRIQPAPLPDGADLRDLILASLEPVLGPAAVLDPALPLEGAPALVLDGEGRATLVSFDTSDPGRALLAGLAALEAVAAAGPWLAGQHPALAEPSALEGLGLLVLGPSAPVGLARAGAPPRVRFGAFRAVRVGDQVGLLVEPLAAAAPPPGKAAPAARPRPFRTGFVSLSADEAAFFERVPGP